MQILSDIQPYNNSAKPVYKYRVWFTEDGLKRRYKVFKVKSTALDFIKQAKAWNKDIDISSVKMGEKQGISALTTPPISRSSIVRYQAIERVCLEYKTSLEEILAFYIQHKERKISDITLNEAVNRYLKYLKDAPLTDFYKHYIKKLLERFLASPINKSKDILCNVSSLQISTWLEGLRTFETVKQGKLIRTNKPLDPITFNNYRQTLSRFFNWGIKQGWVEKNPVDKIEKKRKKAKSKNGEVEIQQDEIKFYTVKQCKEWLDKADSFSKSNIKFYIAMAMFTGIRTAELLRLRFEDVHIESREIVLSASITKTNQRRIVKIPENLVKYIEKECWEGRKGLVFEVGGNGIHCRLKRLSKRLSFSTIQNGFRHTGASYYLAKTQNEYETARQMGHSVEILKRHYAGLVRAKDAEAFYML